MLVLMKPFKTKTHNGVDLQSGLPSRCQSDAALVSGTKTAIARTNTLDRSEIAK
jgi:hypothetical protein